MNAVRCPKSIVHYLYVALPLGLSSAPRIFTKFLEEALVPFKAAGHHSHSLDNLGHPGHLLGAAAFKTRFHPGRSSFTSPFGG